MFKYFKFKAIELLSYYLPNRGKRILFVTLCYCMWSKKDKVEDIKQDIIELNKKLNLTSNKDAINFAVIFKDTLISINNEKDDGLEIKEEDNEKTLLNKIPDWLKYGDDTLLTSDINLVKQFALS